MMIQIAVASYALLATNLVGQDTDPVVWWSPEDPAQGSFVHIIIETTDVPGSHTATGHIAGQELFFDVDRLGHLRALAAVPVNAAASLPMTYALVSGADTTHHFARIPVRPGDFRSERLSVDPRFSRPPDSALAARIRRESRQSVQVSYQAMNTPRLWHGEWVRPRPGRITSEYGTGRVFNGELQSRHMGVDLDGVRGDPIRAGNRGRVALVGAFYYAGNVVYLDHGAGLVTIYMHMSEPLVEEGQIVEAGQVIGRVGATGRVTGPHVHWVGRYGRISVDPLTLFELDATAFRPPVDPATSQSSPRGRIQGR